MTELAKQVIDVVGADIKVEEQKSPDRDYTTDNPKRRCPDISKARKDIKYNPRISLKEGLGRTCAYYQENSSES
jgi:nucleoside-diphosphate-sugar epimerase